VSLTVAEQYLVDTSAWIGLQRGTLPASFSSRLTSLVAAESIATNDVIRVEMLVGCRTPQEYAINDQRFRGLRQLPIDRAIWDAAAGLGFALRRRGVTTALPDLLIAASALEHDAIVVHSDEDFDNIAKHSDLRVESYAETSI